ncbi:MAG TPA: TonB family protein, partial [Polyangiaceae bacterium]|nr:TonB family protein [Polyangiaceae bacterium]
FGPQAESLVAAFAQRCMEDRLKERRSSLRAAAETAERARRLSVIPSAEPPPSLPSGETLSQLSLSLTASGRTTNGSRVPRSLRWRLAAAIAGFGVVALGLGSLRLARNESQVAKTSVAASQVQSAESRERLVAQTPSAAALPTDRAETPRRVAAAAKPERKREGGDSTPPSTPQDATASSSIGRGTGKDDRPQVPGSETAPENSSGATLAALASIAPTAESTPVDPDSRTEPKTTTAPLSTQGQSPTVARASSAPLTVSSRVGHKQLRINPADGAYRPQLPQALARAGQTWDVRVNICVGTAGSVSKVDVIASESPALDRRVVQALSRWRYEPLHVDGEARAFCYPFRYELSGS